MNTLFYDFEAVENYVPGEGEIMLEWLEDQLKEESDRKFVIIDHVYAGARYGVTQMWYEDGNETYFDLMDNYRDRVITEIAGHDHFTSLRYH